MARKVRDMSGTARCGVCGVEAVHERGPGTPLVIRHEPDCTELRAFIRCEDCSQILWGADPQKRHAREAAVSAELPIHRTEAGYPQCATCDGGGCLDCTDPA